MIDINEKLYTTESRRHIYRKTKTKRDSVFNKLVTGVEFYDFNCDKWRPSIVTRKELIEL